MARRYIARALLACVAAAVVLSGCVIDERKYNASIPNPNAPPGDDAGPTLDPSLSTDEETCRDYCELVQRNCTGTSQVYTFLSDCAKICSLLPSGKGDPEPLGKNTVACRMLSAQNAAMEQGSNCLGAGPGGNGVCGSNCEAYCRLSGRLCPSKENEDFDKCVSQCEVAVPETVPFKPDVLAKGDTMQCRLNHLINASQSADDAMLHCPHTTIAPAFNLQPRPSPCLDAEGTPGDCNAYCGLVMFSCQGPYQVYESADQCLAACKALPLGTARDTAQNTVGCRRYHAYNALGDPGTHCSHAGPMGDGHCGGSDNNCESYCRILKRACSEQFFTTYLPTATPASVPANPAPEDDLGTCVQACSDSMTGFGAAPESHYSILSAPSLATDDDNMPGGDSGELLQCRTYHAVLALGGSSGNDPTPSECAAAFGASPCQ